MQMDNENDPIKYLKSGQLWADTLVHSEKSLDMAIDVIGEDYLMLGSDYPFLLGEAHPGKMIEDSVSNMKLREKLLFANACKFLGRDVNFYQN